MSKDNTKSPLQIALGVIKDLDDGRESLSEFSDKASLNPALMIGEDVITSVDQDVIHNINQQLLSIYTGMYLKCIDFMIPPDPKDGEITVERLLEPLSDKKTAPVRSRTLDKLAETLADLTLESRWGLNEGSMLDSFDAENYKESDLSRPGALAVGKVINVPLKVGDRDLTVPVTAVIRPHVFDQAFMQRVLEAFVGEDNGFIARFHKYWNTGEIKSFAEYALALDMIENDKKLRLEDKDGIYSMVKNNRSKGLLTTLVTGTKQMNIASHMVCVTENGKRDLERSMRGKLNRHRDREEFFQAVGAMILTVVNPVRETVTFYQRGIENYGIYSYDDLKGASTNTGQSDIGSILKAFKQGESFSI